MPVHKKAEKSHQNAKPIKETSCSNVIVTAQQQPQPQQQKTITVVGLRLSNSWEYHHPPTSTPLKTT